MINKIKIVRMRMLFGVLVMMLLMAGCATTAQQPVLIKPETVAEEPPTPKPLAETIPELQNIKDEELVGYAQQKGVIFAKTEFEGLLETRYVKLHFVDINDPSHKFHLHIGGSAEPQTFPWEVTKVVDPGYFFVELPAGQYKISAITIPVGSTMATEQMDVSLEVFPAAICYVGTLKMVGTKERIKLGGVPVIKPGFEYTIDVLDDREEGKAAFSQNYPNFPHPVLIKLMNVNSHPVMK